MANSFGFSGESNFFEKKANIIHTYFYHAFTLAGALFLALAGDFAYSIEETKQFFNNTNSTIGEQINAFLFNNWLLLSVGFIFLLIGTLGNYEDSKALLSNNEKLKEENAELSKLEDYLNVSKEENESLMSILQEKHQELVQNWLKTLYHNLDLTSYDRLTIYFAHKGEFTLLARYSSNPMIREVHNQRFPLDEGVLSLSFQHGSHKEINCPHHDTSKKSYYNYMKNHYGYTPDKIDRLTMKSNKYFGLSIRDIGDTLGIIMFENSTQNQHDTFKSRCDIIERYCGIHESYLSRFVREAIRLDRLSNVQEEDESVDNDALEILKGIK